MKTIIIFDAFCILATTAMGQIVNPGYDSTLAKTLGADEYGMKW